MIPSMKRHGRKINIYSEFKKAAWKCNILHDSTYGSKEKGNYGYNKKSVVSRIEGEKEQRGGEITRGV